MIPVLRTKVGVTLKPAPGGFRILAALDAATLYMKQDLTITAGANDHTNGRHPLGEAYDLSVRGMLPADIRKLVAFLRTMLGPAFGVFYETPEDLSDPILKPVSLHNPNATAPHLHLQVAKGTSYPALDVEGELIV